MRIGSGEATVIGTIVVTDVVMMLLLKAPQAPRWRAALPLDDRIRGALRASSPAAQSRAATISDFGFYGLAAFPLLIDAGLVTWGIRGDGDAALRFALVAVEALAINTAATTLLQRTSGRARPFAGDCGTAVAGCPPPAQDNTSFPSGHTSTAFTAASLLCIQHSRQEIFGKADPLVCPLAIAAATATGALRVVADRHWASDVIAGAALGAAVGVVVGWSHLKPDSGPDGPLLNVFGSGSSAGLMLATRFP
ncbi:MAG: phosphatase PAP2 family protein [Myxococcales bacterium]